MHNLFILILFFYNGRLFVTNRYENLHRFLKRELGMPIGKMFTLLKKKEILLNFSHIKKKELLKAGDLILFRTAPIIQKKKNIINTKINVKILYQLSDLQIIHKKPGIACQSGQYLANKNYSLYYRPNNLFPVHRLDFYTEGLLIFAETHQMAITMGDVFKNRKIEKYYLTYVRDSFDSFVYFQNFSYYNKISASYILPISKNIVLVKILTGRKHQIRIHLAMLGAPLMGDKYNFNIPKAQNIQLLEKHITKEDITQAIKRIDRLIVQHKRPKHHQDHIEKIKKVILLNNEKIYSNYYLLSHICCKFFNKTFLFFPSWINI